jgi:hypothetical protein
LRKPYLFFYALLILIVSCTGVPKTENREQLTVSSEQLAVSSEQLAMSNEQLTVSSEQLAESIVTADSASELAEILQPESIPEESVLAEDIETLFVLDGPEPASVVMETLRPVETAPPVAPAVPVETATPLEPTSALEAPALPPPVPEQRTAQAVPPLRESWRQPSYPQETPSPLETPAPADSRKDEMSAIAREPLPGIEAESIADIGSRGSLPEERLLQPDYPITFSRVARATVGQLVEIPFRGRDWVFLGEVGARRGIAYDSRKLDPEGESFIFRVDAAGVYALKFYRQDFARDFILNDHVQIIAGSAPQTTGLAWFNPPIDRSRVIAGPRWPNFLEQPPVAVQPPAVVQPPAEAVRPAAPPAAAPPTAVPPARRPSAARNEAVRPQGLSGDAIAQSSPEQPPAPPPPPPSPPAPESKSPDSILKEAREEFNAGRIASAITLLDQFRKFFPSGSDEAWWLYGQCYEANSPNRNMLAALDYYRRIVSEYPQSSRLSDARRRIAYLERYYINIQ